MNDIPAGQKAEIKLDLASAKNVAEVGIRRAVAFLKESQKIKWEDVPEHLGLDGGVAYGFFPTKADDVLRQSIHSEFQTWVVGSCLKEIDQHFSIFLDCLWYNLELVSLHGKTIHSSSIVPINRKFFDETNSARKADKICGRIGFEFDSESIDSLSRARNALTHNAGRVGNRHLNADQMLIISWCALDMIFDDGEREIVFNDLPADMEELHFPNGAEVFAKISRRTKSVRQGERLSFSERELAEICFTYQTALSKLVDAAYKYIQGKIRIAPVP